MTTTENSTLSISIKSDYPDKLLDDLRNSLTVVTAVLIESDEINYYAELPDSLATLIRFNGELSINK
jgi:hypothetical protein